MTPADHFRVLAIMALADARVEPEEKEMLLRCAEWLELGRAEAGWILTRVMRGQRLQRLPLPSKAEDKERLFNGMINVAVADGVVSPAEESCLRHFAREFGIEPERVPDILRRAQARTTSRRMWPAGWYTEHPTETGRPTARRSPARVRLQAGSVIASKFELRELMGSGGFGRVFRAHHLDLGEDVALKVLNVGIEGDPQAEKRFLHEVKTTRAFLHRFAVPLREFGRDPEHGCLYFTMDLVDGLSLDSVLDREGPLSIERAVRLGQQALEVLQEAHRCGLIHRDLKPANMMITQGPTGEEEVRLVDFGIAKAIGAATTRFSEKLTMEGRMIGTLAYMSPEQSQGRKLDVRSDIYSMGVVLYELISGNLPIEAEEEAADVRQSFMFRILAEPPAPLGDDVPTPLQDVLFRALEKDPGARFQTVVEMREALRQAMKGEGKSGPPSSRGFSRWFTRLRGED